MFPKPDDFEPATENAALIELIRRRIDAEGAITFHDFMELALYHPQHGYYATREPLGRRGDFVTSPEVGPIFGAMVAKQLRECWELLGRPATFDIVEPGPGSGLLARDILRWAQRRDPAFFESMRYRLVEVSASLRRQQQATLAGFDERVEWLDALPPVIEGAVLSNELLDSFPVHRIVHQERQLLEVYVTFDAGRFDEVLGIMSDQRIAEYFADLGLWPGDGCHAEVNLRAVDWMRDVAAALARGFVLTFDYGYPAEELYAPWRTDGTFMCFYRHNPSHDPYARIGRQDMTSHVDFTTLIRAAEQAGLTTVGFTTQARFLAALGIGEGVAAAGETPEAFEEYYARRRAVQELLDPAGLGRIRVLAQAKGIDAPALAGFAESTHAS
jgi:SAM-dependent MidA family methyltransferase